LNGKRLAVVQKSGGFRFTRADSNFVFAAQLQKLNVVGSRQSQPRAQVNENLSRKPN
jgi:hypothetical protein